MGWDASGFLGSVQRSRAAVQPAAAGALHDAGLALVGDALSAGDFPFDTGSLAASGAAGEPEVSGTVVAVMVTFGGTSGGMPNDPVDYADPVHEGYDLVAWGHATGRHIAGRPYLGQPLDADGPGLVEDAAVHTWEATADAWRG